MPKRPCKACGEEVWDFDGQTDTCIKCRELEPQGDEEEAA